MCLLRVATTCRCDILLFIWPEKFYFYQGILLQKLGDFCVNHVCNTKLNLQVSTIVSDTIETFELFVYFYFFFYFLFTETTIAAVPKENGEAVKQRKIFTMHFMSNLCSRKQQLTETLVTKNSISVSLYKTSILL